MAPRPFCYIVRPDTQRRTKTGQIQAVRGANVPLIAVDELPDWIEIYGVPREIPSEQTIGLQNLGLMSKNSEPYLVQLHQKVFAARREQYQGDDSRGQAIAVPSSSPAVPSSRPAVPSSRPAVPSSSPTASPTSHQATLPPQAHQVPVANTVPATNSPRQPPQAMSTAIPQTQAAPAAQPVQTSVPVHASVTQAPPPTSTVPAGLLTSRHAPKPPTATPAQSAPQPTTVQSPAIPCPPPPPPETPSSAPAPAPPAAASQPGAPAQQTVSITTTTATTTQPQPPLQPAPPGTSTSSPITITPAPQEPCLHYLKWGKCKFQPHCKHSHLITPASLVLAGFPSGSFPPWIKKRVSRLNNNNPSPPSQPSCPPYYPQRHHPYSSSSSSSSCSSSTTTTTSSDTHSLTSSSYSSSPRVRVAKRGTATKKVKKQERLLQEMQLRLENLTLKQKERELKVALMRQQQQLGLGLSGGSGGGYTINSLGGVVTATTTNSKKRLRLPRRENTPLDRQRKRVREETPEGGKFGVVVVMEEGKGKEVVEEVRKEESTETEKGVVLVEI
ncbi:Putative protein of unknown function [Podospora comata]|uniref:C3H1-type domain-containing protein n=1 Tax=Podospora comata TaxID=48703 RepID=A0ABY6RU03_PODCO|nr:Putative protein of unknown function [Podospora comata]